MSNNRFGPAAGTRSRAPNALRQSPVIVDNTSNIPSDPNANPTTGDTPDVSETPDLNHLLQDPAQPSQMTAVVQPVIPVISGTTSVVDGGIPGTPTPSSVPSGISFNYPNLPTDQSAFIEALATAIRMANPSTSRPKSPKIDKLDKPDPFDGKDRSKLIEFLASLDMYFAHNSSFYPGSDERKVTLAGSLLRNSAKTWYMSFYQLRESNRPSFLYDYNDFCTELKTRFGIRDEQLYAETEIRKLKMRDTQHFNDFLVKFETCKQLIPDWTDRVFYNTLLTGVAPRITDWLRNLSGNIPTNYDDLCELLFTHDQNVWTINEQLKGLSDNSKEKDKKESSSSNDQKSSAPNSGKSDSNRNKSGKNKHKNKDNKSSSSSATQTSNSSNNASNNNSGKSNNKDLSKVLDSSGKLLQAEKDRRRKEGLCGYCAAKGHFAASCPAKTQSAKGRVGNTSEETSNNSEKGTTA